MIDREKIIREYIDGYNHFDIKKMLLHIDENITFENIQNGVTNMSLIGIDAFRQQAEQAKNYFTERKQTISSIVHRDTETEITIEYFAILAMDFPNGLKKGQALNLNGKSIFEFLNNKIIKLTDLS
jgi:predicted ester cyclase